jgi:hypothetical protein
MLHISSHAIKTIDVDIKIWSIGISMFRRRIDRLTRGKMQQKQTSKSTVHIISVAMIKANATYAKATMTPKSSMPNASSHSFSQHAESQLSVSQRQPQNARLPKKQNKINRANRYWQTTNGTSEGRSMNSITHILKSLRKLFSFLKCFKYCKKARANGL